MQEILALNYFCGCTRPWIQPKGC